MNDAELVFESLGTAVELYGKSESCIAELLADARSFIEDTEQLWSRFIDTSEISKINQKSGTWVEVSPITTQVIAKAKAAAEVTAGIFNPLVDVASAGYVQSIETLEGVQSFEDTQTPGHQNIELLEDANLVKIPEGASIDLGGIAKGYIADLVFEKLKTAGVQDVVVNIGGDMRVSSSSRSIEVEIDLPEVKVSPVVKVKAAGVATSSTRKRRWLTQIGTVSHLRNPFDGTELAKELSTVTIVSDEATKAEVLTKVFLAARVDELHQLSRSYKCSGFAATQTGDVFEFSPAGTLLYEPNGVDAGVA